MSYVNYNPNDYQYLRKIIILDKWIPYEQYLEIWNGKHGIWNFIHNKQRYKKVYINNFGYNYMDAKEFYFSWEKKGRMVNGELIKTCKFDYLDINHEFTRRQRGREMENENDTYKNTVSGPPVGLINVKVDIVRPGFTT